MYPDFDMQRGSIENDLYCLLLLVFGLCLIERKTFYYTCLGPSKGVMWGVYLEKKLDQPREGRNNGCQ